MAELEITARLIELQVEQATTGMLIGSSEDEPGLHVAEPDLGRLISAAMMVAEAIHEGMKAHLVAWAPPLFVLVPKDNVRG